MGRPPIAREESEAYRLADGKVLWHITMSLDGFIAGPEDSMDWAFGDDLGPTEMGNAVVHTTGAILAGRRWFDLSVTRENWSPYGGAWQGPIFVLTHRPPAERSATREGIPVTFLTTSVDDAVGTALKAAGGKDLVVFGATIARACIEAGILDQVLVHVAPVLLGDGVRLFDRPGVTERVPLRRTELAESGQLTDLRFAVVR